MRRYFLAVPLLFFLGACNSQKRAKTEDVLQEKIVSSEKIRAFLNDANFDLVNTVELMVLFDIQKSLIEGTTDEYSNKVVLNDTLSNQQTLQLVELLKDDASYVWDAPDEDPTFDPSLQVLLKKEGQRLFILVDEERKKLGFINLEGQRVVQLSGNSVQKIKGL